MQKDMNIEEDDEIHLLDLFIVLLKYKVMIFSLVTLTGIAAVVSTGMMTKIYRSEATLTPTSQERMGGGLAALGGLAGLGAMIAPELTVGATGSLDQFDVILKSRELTNSIVQKHNLMPILFENYWDSKQKRWMKNPPPNLEDGYKAIHNLLKITPNKKQNVLRLSFESKDPRTAQRILDYFILDLSEFMRSQTLEDTQAQEAQLIRQLEKATDPFLRKTLYELLSKQIEKENLAKIQKYYSFTVIDPPNVPIRKFKPKRAQICILAVAVAFMMAVFLAFFLEYIQKVKTQEDPERLARLRKYARIRNS